MDDSDINQAASTGEEQKAAVSGAMLLPVSITIESVEDVAKEMKALRLDKCRQVVLDFSQVDVMTTPGLQLLVALEKSLAATNGALVLNHMKPGISALLKEAGLERFTRTAA